MSNPGIVAISPPSAPPPLSAYSHAILAGNTLYVSGLVSIDAEGRTVGENVADQTRQVLEQLKAILIAAGAELSCVVHNAIFLKSLSDYKAMNQVYAEYFSSRPPARYCIRADLVRDDLLVEISATAHLKPS